MTAGLLRARPSFRALLIGDAISMVGDWFSYVAVSVVVLGSDAGLLGVALILVAHTLPRVVAAPFAGSLADRIHPRTILISMSVVRGLVVVAMLACYNVDAIAAMQILLFGRMAIGAFVDAAATVAMPRILRHSELPIANRMRGVLWSVVFAVSVATGGVVTEAFGPSLALSIDALTFFGAAFVFRGVRTQRDGFDAIPNTAKNWRDFLWQHPEALRVALAKLPVAIANGTAWIALHAITESWQHAAFGVGVLHACRAIGTAIGPMLWHHLPNSAGYRGIAYSIAATFVGTSLFVLASAPLALAATSLLWGIGVGSNWVAAATRLQIIVPPSLLGRVTAIDVIAQTAGQCVGGLVCASLANALGITGAASVSLAIAAASVVAIELLHHNRTASCA